MRGSSASEKVPFSSERKLMTEMVRRYAHLSAEHTLRRTRIGWAKCKWWRSEFMAQIRHSARMKKGCIAATLCERPET